MDMLSGGDGFLNFSVRKFGKILGGDICTNRRRSCGIAQKIEYLFREADNNALLRS